MGDLSAARPHAEAALERAEKLHDRYRTATVLLDLENLAHHSGDWAAAREFSDRGLELSSVDIRFLYHRAVLEHQTGNKSIGEGYVARLIEAVDLAAPGPTHDKAGLATTIPTVAYITGDLNGIEVAEQSAESLLASSASPRLAHLALAGKGLIAVLRSEGGLAREHYSALESMRGLFLQSGFVCFDRLLGLLARTMDQPDLAAGHFKDATDFCRKAGLRPELAWTCCDYADMLRERDGPGDRAKAATLLDESLAISTELGMRPLMERVLSRRDILKA
jgi:hypothetical protein